MFTVAVISRKGEAGKATLASGLAVASERKGLATALQGVPSFAEAGPEDRGRAARFPLQFPGLDGRGDESSPRGDRGGPSTRGPEQGRGGLQALGPLWTSAGFDA